jgi:hypothetical protein
MTTARRRFYATSTFSALFPLLFLLLIFVGGANADFITDEKTSQSEQNVINDSENNNTSSTPPSTIVDSLTTTTTKEDDETKTKIRRTFNVTGCGTAKGFFLLILWII